MPTRRKTTELKIAYLSDIQIFLFYNNNLIFQYGPFGEYLVESLSYGHHAGGGEQGYAAPPPPPSGYGAPPEHHHSGPEPSSSYESAAGGPQRPKRFPDLPIFRKREGLSKENAKGASSSGYWSGLPADFFTSDAASLQSNFPISSLFFDRR
jgi:hypothetical protein